MTKGDPVSWLCARVRSGQTVVDVGANTGSVSKALARVVGPTGRVHAIEPDPRCWAALESIPHVTVHRVAAAQYAGHAELVQGEQAHHSSLRPAAVDRAIGRITVPMRPLDGLVPGPVQAVKIDVQGGELDVLSGAADLLTRCPVWVIELWPHGLPRGAVTVEAIWSVMAETGLTPYALDEPQPITWTRVAAWLAAVTGSPTKHLNLAWMA